MALLATFRTRPKNEAGPLTLGGGGGGGEDVEKWTTPWRGWTTPPMMVAAATSSSPPWSQHPPMKAGVAAAVEARSQLFPSPLSRGDKGASRAWNMLTASEEILTYLSLSHW